LITERPFFEAGLEHVVKTILPRTIVVYGAAPDNIFDKYVKCGIDIIQFDSVYMSTHRKAVES
jgi:CRISPR/Cas system CMR-associated protein Cmr3 (group 5 of RAMP superfamily)